MRCIARYYEAVTPDAVSRKGGDRKKERERERVKETERQKSGERIQFAVHSHVIAPSTCMNDEEIAKQKRKKYLESLSIQNHFLQKNMKYRMFFKLKL